MVKILTCIDAPHEYNNLVDIKDGWDLVRNHPSAHITVIECDRVEILVLWEGTGTEADVVEAYRKEIEF